MICRGCQTRSQGTPDVAVAEAPRSAGGGPGAASRPLRRPSRRPPGASPPAHGLACVPGTRADTPEAAQGPPARRSLRLRVVVARRRSSVGRRQAQGRQERTGAACGRRVGGWGRRPPSYSRLHNDGCRGRRVQGSCGASAPRATAHGIPTPRKGRSGGPRCRPHAVRLASLTRAAPPPPARPRARPGARPRAERHPR